MVGKEEIKNLAGLARMKLSENEAEDFTKELDSILDYVSQIKDSTTEDIEVVPILRNIMRDDVPKNADSEYTEDILNNAPAREGNFLKVKKILG